MSAKQCCTKVTKQGVEHEDRDVVTEHEDRDVVTEELSRWVASTGCQWAPGVRGPGVY